MFAVTPEAQQLFLPPPLLPTESVSGGASVTHARQRREMSVRLKDAMIDWGVECYEYTHVYVLFESRRADGRGKALYVPECTTE